MGKRDLVLVIVVVWTPSTAQPETPPPTRFPATPLSTKLIQHSCFRLIRSSYRVELVLFGGDDVGELQTLLVLLRRVQHSVQQEADQR